MSAVRGGVLRLADNLRGGKVAKELADIGELMTSGRPGVARSSGLERILSHATRHVPFYQRIGSTRLSEYPVMNKVRIREHGDEMLAQGLAERRVYPATTSGSTGTPFRILRDEHKQLRIQAEAIYWGRLAGYELGQRLFYMKVWSGRNRLSKVALLSRNVVPVDIAQMQTEDYLDLYRAMGRQRSPLSIIAYCSALESFLRALEKECPIDRPSPPPRVAAIIGQSEALPSEVRTAIAERLGRLPYARYGLEELGIVGQQVPGSGERYLVNSASHLVEILDLDRDEPAPAGAVGRIVVTDLINAAQPMIRYDTGDVGAFGVGSDGSIDVTWLQTVSGRRQDQIYDSQDRPLSPMLMYKIWWRHPEIDQYQLVQRAHADYLLRIKGYLSVARERELARELADLVGYDTRIEVERTHEPLVVASGKRKIVVSHYTPGSPERSVDHSLSSSSRP